MILLVLFWLSASHLLTTAKKEKKNKPSKGKRTQKGGKGKQSGKPNGGMGRTCREGGGGESFGPSMPAGVATAARGAKAGYKGAKKGYKAGKKGAKMTKKGVKAGIRATVEAKRARQWQKRRREESLANWSWKKRVAAEIEEDCGIPPIKADYLPRVDFSFLRPQLVRRSRHLNELLRKDWRYLIDEEGNKNFESGRFGANFLMPLGFPPKEMKERKKGKE